MIRAPDVSCSQAVVESIVHFLERFGTLPCTQWTYPGPLLYSSIFPPLIKQGRQTLPFVDINIGCKPATAFLLTRYRPQIRGGSKCLYLQGIHLGYEGAEDSLSIHDPP